MRAEVTISDDVSLLARGLLRGHVEHAAVRARRRAWRPARSSSASPTPRAARSASTCCSCSRRSRFMVDFEASVTVTAGSGDHELFAVVARPRTSRARRPWYAHRPGALRVPGHRRALRDRGRRPNSPDEAPRRRERARPRRDRARADPAAWRAIAPPAASTVLADDDARGERGRGLGAAGRRARGDPGRRAARTAELDHFGAYEIAGPSTLTLAGGSIDGAARSLDVGGGHRLLRPGAVRRPVGGAEKLAAPSYEAMTAGVRFGARRDRAPARGPGAHGDAATTSAR